MDKFSKSNQLNVTLSGGTLSHPIHPTVLLGPKKEGFPTGLLVDANAVRTLTDPIEYDITELEEAVDMLKVSTMPLVGALMNKTFKLTSNDGSSKVEVDKSAKTTIDLIKDQQKAKVQVSTDTIWLNRRKDDQDAAKVSTGGIHHKSPSADVEIVANNGAAATFGGDVAGIVGQDKINLVSGSAYINALSTLALRSYSTAYVWGRDVEIAAMPDGDQTQGHIMLRTTPNENETGSADDDTVAYLDLGTDGIEINVPKGAEGEGTGGRIESSNSVLNINKFLKVVIESPLENPTIEENERVTAAALVDLDSRINELDTEKANASDLATVATSGSYNDLADTPTIPEPEVDNGIIEPREGPNSNPIADGNNFIVRSIASSAPPATTLQYTWSGSVDEVVGQGAVWSDTFYILSFAQWTTFNLYIRGLNSGGFSSRAIILRGFEDYYNISSTSSSGSDLEIDITKNSSIAATEESFFVVNIKRAYRYSGPTSINDAEIIIQIVPINTTAV